MTLKLGRREFADHATLMMAIVNHTPDSFYSTVSQAERAVALGAPRVMSGRSAATMSAYLQLTTGRFAG
jgi:dihydropteroate synthase